MKAEKVRLKEKLVNAKDTYQHEHSKLKDALNYNKAVFTWLSNENSIHEFSDKTIIIKGYSNIMKHNIIMIKWCST